MKEKFNVKGFVKNAAYGIMDGAALTLSWMTTAILGAATVYSVKDYGIKSSTTRAFVWLTVASAFNAVRNTWLTSKYLNGEICDYNFTVMVPDEEDEEDDNIEEI
jgi:hypothetical protein